MFNPLFGWSYCRFEHFLGKVKFERMLERAIKFFNKTRTSNKYTIILLENLGSLVLKKLWYSAFSLCVSE